MSHENLLRALESGELRAATKVDGEWVANVEVKQQILELFRSSKVIELAGGCCDKEHLHVREFCLADKVRLVPCGSAVRAGAHVGQNVVIMPPSYINIGAFIDDGTMIDSHVLIGSCAQIGKRIHVAAGAQIGGVLEPAGERPVIVEDDSFIGAGVLLLEGVVVRKGAVIAPGVTLTKSVPIYDLVHDKIYKGEVPALAVVVPGCRPITSSEWGRAAGLSVGCAIVVKYRDEKTGAAVALESALRGVEQ